MLVVESAWQGRSFVETAIGLLKGGDSNRAMAVAKEAFDLGQIHGDKQQVAVALIVKAMGCVHAGDPFGAVSSLEAAHAADSEHMLGAYAQISRRLFPTRIFPPTEDLSELAIQQAEVDRLEELHRTILQEPTDYQGYVDRSLELGQIDTEIYGEAEEESLALVTESGIRQDFILCDATAAILAADDPSAKEGCYIQRSTCWSSRPQLWAGFEEFDLRCYQHEVADVRQAIACDIPPGGAYDLDLARALLHTNQLDEVMHLVPTNPMELEPDDVEAWLAIQADALQRSGQYAEAVEARSLLVVMQEDAYSTARSLQLLDRAECYLELGKFQEALDDVERLLQVEPQQITSAVFLRYRIWLRMGRWDEVQATIEGDESEMASAWIARRVRAEYLMKLNRWEEAKADLLALIEAVPDVEWEAHRDLAEVYSQLGQADRAAEHSAQSKAIFDALEPWDR